MRKKIKMFERTDGNGLFSIDKFTFEPVEACCGKMIKYALELSVNGYDPLDVRFLLEEAVPGLEFILDVPEELTDYIKKYEENRNPEDESLFHDLRTKYIEFIKCGDESLNIEEQMIILGFSIAENKIYIVLKVFSLNLLSAFLEKVKKYCSEKEIDFKTSEDIRWIELMQYVVKEKETIRGHQKNEFLEKTLVKSYFPRFLNIFRKIDRDGYFKRNFYNEVMFQEKTLKEGRKISVPIHQVSKFFSPYWKYTIRANSREILCLHDKMLDDEKIEEYVYTFKPDLLGYYLNNWFEDFTVEMIKRTDFSPYTVTHMMSGCRFDFFGNKAESDIREIDVSVSVEYKGVSKLIAIECKKTLSDKEIQTTNKKSREKVINSGHNVFDAFIHVGCFSNEIDFEKKFGETGLHYKQGLIEGSDENADAPFYAFDITSKEDYEKKLFCIIKDIFDNW